MSETLEAAQPGRPSEADLAVMTLNNVQEQLDSEADAFSDVVEQLANRLAAVLRPSTPQALSDQPPGSEIVKEGQPRTQLAQQIHMQTRKLHESRERLSAHRVSIISIIDRLEV